MRTRCKPVNPVHGQFWKLMVNVKIKTKLYIVGDKKYIQETALYEKNKCLSKKRSEEKDLNLEKSKPTSGRNGGGRKKGNNQRSKQPS